MPLHLKTSLLAAIIILLVMAATLGLFSSRVLSQVQKEQRERAEFQAEDLAEQINDLPAPRDYQEIARLVALLRSAKQTAANSKEVRIWERAGNRFVERVAEADSNSANFNDSLPEEIKTALRGAQEVRTQQDTSDGVFYRVYVPVFETLPNGVFARTRVSGAVEVTLELETTWTLVYRFLLGEVWLALASVAFLSLAIYWLFRWLVYRPLDKLAWAMRRAKDGQLEVRAQIESKDEFGELAQEFNRMLAQLQEMTVEREARQTILQAKVREATHELAARNHQLETASHELWQTSRKISELERLAAAGTTAAQFAHEVGTPLNLISGHVQLLRMNLQDNPAAETRLQTVTAQIERIEKIVRAMLDKTRFGETDFDALDLNQLLQKIVVVTAPTLDAKNVKLEIDLSDDLPNINGNADRLQQVFINLVNNALDAMPTGGELKIKTCVENNHVVARLADDGIGMSDETKSRLFEPLYTTKQRGHGTGLGLVVVRQILEEHRAAINVNSKLGAGTEFVLTFPIENSSENSSENSAAKTAVL